MSRADLDQLLNVLLPYAQQLLDRHGEFYPFGASMAWSGEISLLATETAEHPTSEQVMEWLELGLRETAATGEVKAVATCLDVEIVPPDGSPKTDAVEVRLEHRKGEAVRIFLPYRRNGEGGIRYGELVGCEDTHRFFPQNGRP